MRFRVVVIFHASERQREATTSATACRKQANDSEQGSSAQLWNGNNFRMSLRLRYHLQLIN